MGKYKKTKCAICGTVENSDVLYDATSSIGDLNTKVFSARRLPDRIHYQIVKCKTCGLIRSDPVFSGASLVELYKESKFTYESEVNNLNLTYLDAMQSVLVNLGKNARILEIGCGNGFLLDALRKKGYKNVKGIEPSTDAVKKSSKEMIGKLVTGFFGKDSFPDEKFDFIFFFQTLDHISDPSSFLGTCYNLLNNGGYILAFNHNVESLSSKILGKKSPIFDMEHTFLYSRDTIVKLFEKHFFLTVLVFFPANYLSLRHLLWLAPFPVTFKMWIFGKNFSFLRKNIKIKLGNICYIGQKII